MIHQQHVDDQDGLVFFATITISDIYVRAWCNSDSPWPKDSICKCNCLFLSWDSVDLFHFIALSPSVPFCPPLLDPPVGWLCLIHTLSSLPLSLCPPQSLQECPSGVVNEDTFKQIYSQFFPHGGTVQWELALYCLCLLMLFLPSVQTFFPIPLQMQAPTHTTCSMRLTQEVPAQSCSRFVLFVHSFPDSNDIVARYVRTISLFFILSLFLCFFCPSGLCISSVHPAEGLGHREAPVDI